MPGMNAPMGILTVPIWVAGAASAVFLVSIVLAIGKAGAAALIASLFRVAIVALGVYAGWVYLQRAALQDQAAERRSLDERSAALMARAIAPGLALSCLDGLAGEAVEVACEKAVFASPEAVAAAVSYVMAQLGLLAEGTEHAERNDTAYRAELVALRATIELDRFGIVAHALSRRDGCTVERCDALMRLHDTSHVLANMSDGIFDEQVAKYTASWNSPSHPKPAEAAGPAVAVVAPAAPIATNPTPSPATVAPRYDFPSSRSIPPVNIMAPEPPEPRQPAAASDAQTPAPGAANGRPATTPLPPRRPPRPAAPSSG